MKRKLMSLVLAALLAAVLCFSLTACGETQPSGPSNTDKNKDPYVTKVDITKMPTKTEYYEGEIFDPKGLTFDATWIIEGKEKVISLGYGTCQGWTHKNEPLTSDVTKITFTLYGCEFDVAIEVKPVSGLSFIIDSSMIKAEYSTDDHIDLTQVKGYLKEGEDNYLTVEQDKFSITDNGTEIPLEERYAYPCTEGTHEFEIKYLGLSQSFTVEVIDASKVVTPYHVQAETSTFFYKQGTGGTNGTDPTGIFGYGYGDGTFVETDDAYNRLESESWYDKTDQTLIRKIKHGAEGSVIANTEKHTNFYIKFTVNVPATGNYDILVRAQATGTVDISNSLLININGAEKDGQLVYEPLTSDEKILRGNQRYNENGELDGTSWFNMYFWTTAKLGTFELQKGDNVIRFRPTGNSNVPNIDYFEVQKEGSTSAEELKVINERGGEGVVLNDTPVYIKQGEKLGDITGIGAEYPDHYTLLYLRTFDYVDKDGNKAFIEEIPITEEMISGIDYGKLGEQVATVNYTSPSGKSYTATFNVVITSE